MLGITVGELWECRKKALNAGSRDLYELSGKDYLSSSGAYRSREYDLFPDHGLYD
jgi:hypothetical protein